MFSKFIDADTKQVVVVNHSHIVIVDPDTQGPGSYLVLTNNRHLRLDIDARTVAALLRGDQDKP
jgi:hypothetical protein